MFYKLYLIVIYLFVVIESQQSSHQMEAEKPSHAGKRSDLSQAGQGPDVLTIRHDSSGSNPAAARWRTLLLRWSGGPRFVRNNPEDQKDERIEKALNYANSRVSELRNRVRQFAKREAEVLYIRGMLPGGLYVLALVAIYVGCLFGISAGRHWTFNTYLSWFLIPIAVTCGALGATVSVLLRVANEPLSVDYHAGRRLIHTAGVVRPIIGAVFGLVFYIIVNAGLLQVLTAPTAIIGRAHYIAAICFIAGFSERRAQDAIVRVLPAEAEAPADKPLARRPEEDEAS